MSDPIVALLGPWAWGLNTSSIIFRVFFAVVLGTIVGWERTNKRHSAGLRTFILVSLTTTIGMMLDQYLSEVYNADMFIISGSSLICLAILSVNTMVYSSRNQIKGLTTSVGLLTCGVIGLSLGCGLYFVTVTAFVLFMISLSVFPTLESFLKNRSNHFEIHLELTDSRYLQNFVTTIRRLGLIIDDIEMNPAYANSGLSVYSISISISNDELKKYKTHEEIIQALSTLDYVYHIEEMII
ncbi:MAG: MgtC/SapB family protein [Erysipelotrichaceae bacterium]|nr:MgtC/SapB family protein [Erysipelotrichaceae bacterium]